MLQRYQNKLIYCDAKPEYRDPIGPVPTGGKLRLFLRCCAPGVRSCTLLTWPQGESGPDHPMEAVPGGFAVNWQAPREAQVIFYRFRADTPDGPVYIGRGAGPFYGELCLEPEALPAFQLTVWNSDFTTPDWCSGGVMYQIFPDRFRREPVETDTEPVEPWTSTRVQNQYRFGGNLRGILKAVPYLKDLGVKMIYTTPLFLSDSSHRYNTFDYFKIDPLLGTEDDLRALCDELHKNDMRIVLDGVFNHSGLKFAPFVDAMEKGEASPYRGWFCFDDKMPYGYHTFGDWRYMPKLNLQNEDCAQYFLSVGRYWLEKCHVDGWRLDVSPEVWPDFWRQFKTMMRKVNPDSLMVAECWDDSREWLTVGDMFDSTMHYVLSRNIWSRFCRHEISTAQFDCALNRAAMLYPQRTQEVLWTFLGSHDTQRIRTRAGGDLRMVHAASFFQFTYLGSPIIYYGDELGMEGGEDPDCRRPMRWDDVEDNPTRAHYQKLARLRAQLPALRTGRFRSHVALENGLYAFRRETDTQQLLCVVNTGLEPVSVRLELPGGMAGMAAVHDHYSGRSLAVADGGVHISLKVGEGLILE